MPVPIRAFACGFGCKRNVLTSRSAMAKHEDRCFRNPIRRACQTCANLEIEPYDELGNGGTYCLSEAADIRLDTGLKCDCLYSEAKAPGKETT